MKVDDDAFDIENLRLRPEQVAPTTPRRIAKRRAHFIRVPFDWLERLQGASGQVYAVALHLLYLRWQHKGRRFTLPNGMLRIDGVGRTSKWRALVELEHRGLVSIERRPRKSPWVTVN